ncbi:MAG: EAL domain-containing protein, partial [Marinobacter sp.]
MAGPPDNNELFTDLTEALAMVCSVVCVAVIVKDGDAPSHLVGDPDAAKLLVTLDSVQATLADGIPRTEAPPFDTALAEAAFIAVEPLSIPHQQSLNTVIAFAGKHSNDCERTVALVHALTTETANELMVLRQAPFLAAAFAQIECGVTIADPNLADTPLIYANAAYERMTGYSRAELLGRNCRFLQGGLRDQSGLRVMRNALARGTDCTAVVTNFRKNGESFENRVKLRAIRTNDGTLSHIIGIQLDVSREHSALESLARQKRRYESMIDTQASYIWLMNAEGELIDVPEKWLELAGLSPSSDPLDLATIRGALAPEAAEAFRKGWVEALRNVAPFEVVYQLPAQSLSPRWFLDRITPVFDDENKLTEWIAASQEITELKRAETDLQRIIDAAPTGMIVVDKEGNITLANTQAGLLFDCSPEEITGMSVDAFVPSSVRTEHKHMRAAFLENPVVRRMGPNREVEGVRKNGTRFPLDVGLGSYGEGDDLRVIAAFSDTTELKYAREEVERAAYEDRLTGLLSSEGFAQRLDERLKEKNLHPASPVVVVDVKALREINNTQGYDIGDEVLREVARRLAAEIGDSGLIARTGGDEFTVLAPLANQRSSHQLRRCMAAVFGVPFEIRGFAFHVEASFGYARIRSSAGDARKLMTDAALAMHRSQHNPALTWTQYTKALEHQTRENVDMTTKLRHAIEADQLALYYQPQVDLASGCIVAAEALLRWNHPQAGFISPGQFIPLAEQSQLIGPIGDWVLRQACRDISSWRDAGLPVTHISINLSLIQFQLGSIPDKVRKALTDYNVAPEMLTLEITESVFEQHSQALKRDLEALSAMGVRLSLDDFGTGYSSLAHLNDYFFDEIKIDKSFVFKLDKEPYAQAIVKAVIV